MTLGYFLANHSRWQRFVRFLGLLIVAVAVGAWIHSWRNAPRSDGMCAISVRTQSGLIRGISDPDSATCSWRGIPYAAPPIGDLRWRLPKPPAPWQGVRDGSQWGRRCVQPNNLFWRYIIADPSDDTGEDCLFLNVWRPRKVGAFPVVVVLPGGGFGMGTGNMPGYWGDRLCEHGDLVVVTINYRLGMLGFLALPELRDEDSEGSTGNYGIHDQLAALEWVQRNIAEFGGDPGNVTLLGQSAGGWSVCTLLASAKSTGLFHRAIMESGGCNRVQTLEDGFSQGRSFARRLGCAAEDLACLRRLSSEQIEAETPLPTWTYFGYGPHVDGVVLAATPIEQIRSGVAQRVPLLTGTNRDEIALQLRAAARDLAETKPSAYADRLAQIFPLPGDSIRQLLDAYPLAEFHDEPIRAFQQMATDLTFACPTYDSAMAAALVQPTYLYRFDYSDIRFADYAGATHSIEIPFVLDAFDRRSFSMFFNSAMAERARPLSRIMQRYWIQFARTGEPNAPGLPIWPRFSPQEPAAHLLNKVVGDEPIRRARACAFWRTHPLGMGW